MRWFAGVAIAYVALMLLAVGGIQFLSHAGRTFAYQLRGPTGVDYLRVYRDAPIPAIFGGRGGAPGEVEAVDLAGRVLDSEHVPNIDTVSVVDWERYRVDFEYQDAGSTFRDRLDLAQ
jgi:hypothetical protein